MLYLSNQSSEEKFSLFGVLEAEHDFILGIWTRFIKFMTWPRLIISPLRQINSGLIKNTATVFSWSWLFFSIAQDRALHSPGNCLFLESWQVSGIMRLLLKKVDETCWKSAGKMTKKKHQINTNTTRKHRRNDESLLASTLLWQHGWEVRTVYQIPTVRAVHILSTDTGSPGGSVAKQVTVCFKSLPDAPFSQTQMRNRKGPPRLPWEGQYWYDGGMNPLASYSEDGEWFIGGSSSVYMRFTCLIRENNHEFSLFTDYN